MLDLAAKAASVAEASRDFQSEGFFEYHLYTLDGRTTIKDNQTKQLALLTSDEVPVTKQLIYYGAQDYYRNAYGVPISNQKVAVYLELRNSKEHRLGVPLRSEEHTSELQSLTNLVCRLLLEKKKKMQHS